MAQTIAHSLLEAQKRNSQHPAAMHSQNGNWKEESWQDFYRYVEKIAGGLSLLGLRRGDRVAVISETRFEWSIIDMAVLAMGGVTVPIYPSSTEEDIEYILNNSETKFLFCEDKIQYRKWEKVQGKCPTVNEVFSIESFENQSQILPLESLMKKGEEKRQEAEDFLKKNIEACELSDMATIVYTSGTTGLPKGVVLTHQQISSEINDVFKILDVEPGHRSLCFLPFSHIFGRIEMWGSVHTGFTLGYAESIERLKANLLVIRPTFLIAVPRIFEKIYNGVFSQAETSPVKIKIFKWALSVGRKVSRLRLDKKPIPFPLLAQYKIAHKLVFAKLHKGLGGELLWAISGSAPLSKEISEFFHAAGILVLEGYGLTETTGGIFMNTPHDFQFGNVGKAIGEVQAKIASDGEILIKSHKIMKEYYKNPEATAEAIQDDWFHTGDIGELSDDGRLRITDRKKDLIKTAGGKYVAPQKLENMLKLNKYVSNVLIHGDQRKYVVALVTLDEESIKKYAEDNDMSYANYEGLVKNEKVQGLIRGVVADANSSLASYETIKNFAILPADFSIESGELTPSLKVKRKVCDQRYKEVINGLYGVDRSSI